MPKVGRREFGTQADVLTFLQEELGYRYLGNWKDRSGNRNIESALLKEWLLERGVEPTLADKAISKFEKTATITAGQQLFDANRGTHESLRYGVKVDPGPGRPTETIFLVDWSNPAANRFDVAEEVTVEGRHTKRPDLVLYVNGIAMGVIELKRSTVSVSEGIRQNLLNQRPEFIEHFFTTVQLVMAANETEGLRYGVIHTPEKYFLQWKRPAATDDGDRPLLGDLEALCRPDRMLELVHDFIAFDGGVKKICRHNQYEGVKAAQAYVSRREGGIVWHTQGSGKSLTMVWFAKWILEQDPAKRVLIVTDRVELDEQIEKVFNGVGEEIRRTLSGADLLEVLGASDERLVCSLIHKFGRSVDGDVGRFAEEIRSSLPSDFQVKGDVVVFIDECHRSQMGDLHRAMRAILPEDATLIGFTGTPLLRKDKTMSRQVFGDYIHTYKFDEAVRDGVVLDLRYHARDIEQRLTSPEKVDQWFEAKTSGLTDVARSELKKKWGTLQQVLSARSRLDKIVADICLDFARMDRLISGDGNAMLVAGSIYEACRFYELFQDTPLAGHCAVVTSYQPAVSDIRNEATAEGKTQAQRQFDTYRKMLADHFRIDPDKAMSKVEEFERAMRQRFIKEPGRLKLLIVVDKLLTGFDAPPATVLYIDKQMQDHGLFQAICRVNRLDGETKTHGQIIDYKDLFKSLERAMTDYTGEAFGDFDREDVAGLLKDRLATARENLEETRESIKALCEPVAAPRHEEDYIRYFCRGTGQEEEKEEKEDSRRRRRVILYRLAARYVRCYADLANEMVDAGYSSKQAAEIKAEVAHYDSVRQAVKLASGDYVDLKQYEPDMRHLLDRYLQADDSRTLHDFKEATLMDLLVRNGTKAVDKLPESIRSSEDAVAETIENNVRKVIVDEMASNPRYFADMSELLDAILEERRNKAIEYREFLEKIAALANRIVTGTGHDSYPEQIVNGPQRAFFDNLDQDASLAVGLDEAIRSAKEDGWRGHRLKEKKVRRAIAQALELDEDHTRVGDVLEIAKNQDAY